MWSVRRAHVQQGSHHEHRVRRGAEAVRVPVLRLPRRRPHPGGRPQHVLVPATAATHVRRHRRNGIQVSNRFAGPLCRGTGGHSASYILKSEASVRLCPLRSDRYIRCQRPLAVKPLKCA